MNKIFHYGIILFIIVGLIFNKQEAMLKALLQHLLMSLNFVKHLF